MGLSSCRVWPLHTNFFWRLFRNLNTWLEPVESCAEASTGSIANTLGVCVSHAFAYKELFVRQAFKFVVGFNFITSDSFHFVKRLHSSFPT